MATPLEARERLQPALLDRLIDDAPSERRESEAQRVMTKAQLRQAVLRDLSWLFNATQPRDRIAETHPALGGSVLNFGLPALSGLLASKVDVSMLERAIKDTIQRFEPRLLPESLHVKALEVTSVLDTHNMIEFEIHALLWAQPVPLEVLLRTKLDLEAGLVEVRDIGAVPSARARL
jgi:type VI secretion system protein ImpF